MDIRSLHALGLTNLTEEQLSKITESLDFSKAVELAKLSPTQRHLHAIEEQKKLGEEISQLKSENARLKQSNKTNRILGALSAVAITIGGALISSFSDGSNEQLFGLGWGLTIVGVGIIFINSILGS